MELIGQTQNNATQKRQEALLLFSQTIELRELRKRVKAKYGNKGVTILNKYNPDYILCSEVSEEDCYFGDSPTLASLGSQFDKKYPVAWLMAHLHDLSEFCGCKDKLAGHPLQQCAGIISIDFYWLKVSELILFFHRFKSGRYGKFYGAVDPIVIMEALKEFCRERNVAYCEREKEAALRQMEESRKNSCTWEEYLKQKGEKQRPSPLSKAEKRITRQ